MIDSDAPGPLHPMVSLLPPGVEPPPGLEHLPALRDPPGLGVTADSLPLKVMPSPVIETSASKTADSSGPPPIPEMATDGPAAKQGIESMKHTEIDGEACIRADWRIANVIGKLECSLDQALASPLIAIAGLSDFKLLVKPRTNGPLQSMRGKNKQSAFKKLLKDGPLHCGLQVKVATAIPKAITFYLIVGDRIRKGPFTCNFAEQPMHECRDFECNWLDHIAKGALLVSIEIVL
jgi:hypothetical protein